jgi:hypothetical protein
VQITADITGSRSINAMNALTTPPGTDAGIAGIVQQAGNFAGSAGSLNATTKGLSQDNRIGRKESGDGQERNERIGKLA